MVLRPYYESESPIGLIKTQTVSLPDGLPVCFWLSGAGWGLRMCVSHWFPDEAEAAGPGCTLRTTASVLLRESRAGVVLSALQRRSWGWKRSRHYFRATKLRSAVGESLCGSAAGALALTTIRPGPSLGRWSCSAGWCHSEQPPVEFANWSLQSVV